MTDLRSLLLCFLLPLGSSSFHVIPSATRNGSISQRIPLVGDSSATSVTSTQLHIFDKIFEEGGKIFEDSGPLGKGITVGKVQVALACSDRSGIFAALEKSARDGGSSSSRVLAQLANDVCLGLLRRSDDWTAATSTSQWFNTNDAGKAESLFNDWSNREAAKFEKEYVPTADSEEKEGGPTNLVVSVVVEIQGDQTKFDGAGFSLAGTREVLSNVASDVLVDRGDCVNAVEIFWTPSERKEVLTRQDVIIDFPELIDL